ncbi:MAG: hypothetical protein KBD37_06165 [Burkholderiales bacterium]|nr:hypothetical protein [Burkholderiales bacterium]
MCFPIGQTLTRLGNWCIPSSSNLEQPLKIKEISSLFNNLTSWFGVTPEINKGQFVFLHSIHTILKENRANSGVNEVKLGNHFGINISYVDNQIKGECQGHVYCLLRVNNIASLVQDISKCCDRYRSSILDKHNEGCIYNFLVDSYVVNSQAALLIKLRELSRLHELSPESPLSLSRSSIALVEYGRDEISDNVESAELPTSCSRSSTDSVGDFKDSISGNIDTSEIIPLLLNYRDGGRFNGSANKDLELCMVQYLALNQDAVRELATMGIFDSVNNGGDIDENPLINQLRQNGYKQQAELARLYTLQYFKLNYESSILINFEILSRQRRNSTKNLVGVINDDVPRVLGVRTEAIKVTLNERDIPLDSMIEHKQQNANVPRPFSYEIICQLLNNCEIFSRFLEDQQMLLHKDKIINMLIFAANQENFSDCFISDSLKLHLNLNINEAKLKKKISLDPIANKISFWQSYNVEFEGNVKVSHIQTSHQIVLNNEIRVTGDLFMGKYSRLIKGMKITSINIDDVERYDVSAQKISAVS